ncbi:MAG: hypothetical protein GQ534_11485 [Candidatus Delongbacteria bacterium]|nr:hypothetical protein [Candidatus Delongbacteria bacterium]
MFKKFSSAMLVLLFVVTMSVISCGKTSDMDAMLDQYEKMMTKYMPLMEKAAKGDGKVDGKVDEELAKMGKEMEEWSKKWEGKMEKLSEEDMVKVQKRMMEIAQKMYKK